MILNYIRVQVSSCSSEQVFFCELWISFFSLSFPGSNLIFILFFSPVCIQPVRLYCSCCSCVNFQCPLFGLNNCFLYFNVLCILRGVFLRGRIKTVFLHLISLRDLSRHRGFSKITPLNSIFVMHIIFMEDKWPWVDFLLPVQLSILSALWNLIFWYQVVTLLWKGYHLYSWFSELAWGELDCKVCVLHLRSVAKIEL